MLRFESFLNLTEAKIDDLINRESQSPIQTSHDPDAKFVQTNDIINHFHQANPTKDINHTQWLVNQYRKGDIKQEDAPAMTQMLTNFNKHRDKLQRKNINQYKNTSELLDALRPHTEEKSKTDIQKEKSSEAIRKGSTLIHDDSDVSLYHVHDKEAAKELGRGLPWCTSNRDDEKNRFDHYNEKTGRRFFIAHMKNEEAPFRRIGIGNGVGEFQDENNKRISDTTLKSLIKRNPSLKQIRQLHGTRILLTPENEHGNYVNDLIDNTEKPEKINLEKGNISKDKISQILKTNNPYRNAPNSIVQRLVNLPNWDNYEHTKILADKQHYGDSRNNNIAIEKNPSRFDERTINMLVNHPEQSVRANVAQRPELSHDHIDKLMNDPDLYHIIARRNDLTPNHIDRIYNHAEPIEVPGRHHILSSLIQTNKLSKDRLERLSSDSDRWVSDDAKKALNNINQEKTFFTPQEKLHMKGLV